jgi:hypothetical protein
MGTWFHGLKPVNETGEFFKLTYGEAGFIIPLIMEAGDVREEEVTRNDQAEVVVPAAVATRIANSLAALVANPDQLKERLIHHKARSGNAMLTMMATLKANSAQEPPEFREFIDSVEDATLEPSMRPPATDVWMHALSDFAEFARNSGGFRFD